MKKMVAAAAALFVAPRAIADMVCCIVIVQQI